MKYIVSTIAAMLLGCSFYSQAITPEKMDYGNIERFADDNKRIKENNIPCKVVFLGNSITEGWAKEHPSFFQDNGFVGRGISGQTSSQFLLRFREDVVNLHPEIVVINAGTNDCAENIDPYNEDLTFGNIVTMADIACANGIRVVLSSVLPAKGFGWRPEIQDAPSRISSLNKKIEAYAKEQGIPYIDYYSAMVAEPDKALSPSMTRDGVHPTPEGYDVMESLALPLLQSLLAPHCHKGCCAK